MSDGDLSARIEQALGARITASSALPVGFGLEGLELRLADGRHLAVKARNAGDGPSLEIEAYMLGELARLSELPVPRVHHADADLLIWISSRRTAAASRRASSVMPAS